MSLYKQDVVGRDATAIRSALRTTLAAACIGLFASASASAGTLVTSWGYSLENGFTAFAADTGSPGAVTGSNPNAFLAAPTKLEWPDPLPDPGNSFLEVGNNGDGTDSGMLTTGAAAIDTILLSHGNFPQGLGTSALDTATLTDVLTLTPLLPPAASFMAPAITIDINFKETDNGGPHPDDIFVLDIAGAGFNPITQQIDQIFPFEMFFYKVSIGLEGITNQDPNNLDTTSNGMPALSFLSELACSLAITGAVSGTTGCIGLTTAEGMQTDFRATLQIMSLGMIPVAEPGTLAILGLGLIGLGVARRRRAA